ncbi:MAG TPA: TerB family tellurite resistance protein [Hyphomonadaceae bacterium]|nr:TerB family tellurite resistance protein [Hyphomonadaceae bacterium]
MAVTALLDAAARAFAMVAYSDGNLVLTEETRFAKFAATDAALSACPREDVKTAWAQAVKEVQASPSFGEPLLAIRTEIKSDQDKQAVMRAAEAAVVADGKVEQQENLAIQKLAEALGLDPEDY